MGRGKCRIRDTHGGRRRQSAGCRQQCGRIQDDSGVLPMDVIDDPLDLRGKCAGQFERFEVSIAVPKPERE